MKAKMNNFSAWIDETRPDVLHGYFSVLLKECGFNILSHQQHLFTPYGFTELYLLGESHFAIHTFPEQGTTYIELSSCVDDPFNAFKKAFTGHIPVDL